MKTRTNLIRHSRTNAVGDFPSRGDQGKNLITESDMTEQKNPADSAEELVRLEFFTSMAKAIVSAGSLRETIQQVMHHIGKVFAAEHWSLMRRDRKTGELSFLVVTGSAGDHLRGKKLPRGTGIAGWIAEHGEPLIISDVSRDSRFNSEMDRIADFTTRSIIGVPLVSGNHVFGVIELVNKIDGQCFTPLELKMLTTIADFAAISIEKSYYVRVLKSVALLDPLTSLYNRRIFGKYLRHERDRLQRHGIHFSVIMIDVDDFKSINDLHGHVTGDRVLQTVAKIIKSSVRTVDIAARYGGDEFVVILPDSGIEAAEHAKSRIVHRLVTRNRDEEPKIALSIGIDEATPDTVDEIIDTVDKKMYEDKLSRGDEETSFGDMADHLQEVIDAEEF